jgi:hypothetical protein
MWIYCWIRKKMFTERFSGKYFSPDVKICDFHIYILDLLLRIFFWETLKVYYTNLVINTNTRTAISKKSILQKNSGVNRFLNAFVLIKIKRNETKLMIIDISLNRKIEWWWFFLLDWAFRRHFCRSFKKSRFITGDN